MKKRLPLIVIGALIFIAALVYFCFPLTQTDISQLQNAENGSFIQLGRGTVQYECSGTPGGETIVLVSGFSVPYYCWDPVVDLLAGQGYYVVRYNHYGRGLSGRISGKYTLDVFEEELSQVITSLTLKEPVHIAGLSMGGLVAMRYAVDNPSHVKTLSLISPAGYVMSDSFSTKLVKTPVIGDFIMRVFGKPVLSKRNSSNLYEPEKYPEFQSQFEKQFGYRGFTEALLSSLRYTEFTNSPQTFKELGKTDIPVLVCWGREDAVIPYEHTKSLLQDVKAAHLFTIEGAGHNSQYEKPGEVAYLIDSFIQQNLR